MNRGLVGMQLDGQLLGEILSYGHRQASRAACTRNRFGRRIPLYGYMPKARTDLPAFIEENKDALMAAANGDFYNSPIIQALLEDAQVETDEPETSTETPPTPRSEPEPLKGVFDF